MARRRFFVPQVRRGVAELTGDEAEHLVRVLRAEAGQIYEISDNQDLYLARISVARKSMVSFEVIETLPTPIPSVSVTLVAALFKFDRFEWMLEKATELGIDQIVPFEAVRSERGLMQAAVKRHARWERIALESSQQARRTRLPVIAEAVSFKTALATSASCRIFLDEDIDAPAILPVLSKDVRADFSIALLVGPEGGWTDEERTIAVQEGWTAASLGATILRAETAGVAGLSIVRAWASAEVWPCG